MKTEPTDLGKNDRGATTPDAPTTSGGQELPPLEQEWQENWLKAGGNQTLGS